MRYEEPRRLRGVESAWLRLKLWLRPAPVRRRPIVGDLNHLSEHERRDIGLDDPVRYMDWRQLTDNDRS
ncbi:hypothetical protein JKG68_21295 [Microvirga aerilata]|uniref:DUF1127 domain-containing protein n=1 Tax=Microvirga aerilata TaxID=670292 RepID=A0A937CY53_9HYPH|nr:hypothetical protein [Microvirga aerilata]MBL0406498.1 hypothetical protein [Microvirga aerilata]